MRSARPGASSARPLKFSKPPTAHARRGPCATIHERVKSSVARYIALVAPTSADARDVLVQGPAGILATAPPGWKPIYQPSVRRLTWPNGTKPIRSSPRSMPAARWSRRHWRMIDPKIPFKAVHASRGKVVRAQPVAQIYEEGRGHHV